MAKKVMIASCGFLENELRQFSGEEVTLVDSVETLGGGLKNITKKAEGAKEKARKKKCNVRFSLIEEE